MYQLCRGSYSNPAGRSYSAYARRSKTISATWPNTHSATRFGDLYQLLQRLFRRLEQELSGAIPPAGTGAIALGIPPLSPRDGYAYQLSPGK